MNEENMNEQDLIKQIREALDDSVERIDAETRHKLIEAREQALVNQKSFVARHWGKAVFATSFSVALVALIFTAQFNSTIQDEELESMELIAAQDTFEMYEELDFYTWLVEEDAAG